MNDRTRAANVAHHEAGLIERAVAYENVSDDHLVVPAPDHTHLQKRRRALWRLRTLLAQYLCARKAEQSWLLQVGTFLALADASDWSVRRTSWPRIGVAMFSRYRRTVGSAGQRSMPNESCVSSASAMVLMKLVFDLSWRRGYSQKKPTFYSSSAY